LGNKGRWELLRAIFERYRKAGRKEKNVILSEFCANAGYNRKYAIRLLNGPRAGQWKSEPRRGRGVSYGQEVVALLTARFGLFRQLVVHGAADQLAAPPQPMIVLEIRFERSS